MHTIDGEQFDAEIMMVHNTGSDSAGLQWINRMPSLEPSRK